MSAEERSKEERQEIRDRTAPHGVIVYEAIYNEAEHELQRDSGGLAWSGLAAGLSMGFSMLSQAVLLVRLPDSTWESLIVPLGYTVGFLFVILGRQQLFTENTLTPILPLLRTRRWSVLRNVFRLWSVVLLSNLVGGFAFALVVAHTGLADEELRDACIQIGRKALDGSFGLVLWRGIFAGWLIALMVWLLPFAESARVWVIALISYLIGLIHLPHIIAGGIEIFFLVVSGEVGFWRGFTGYLAPTLIGNTVGGVALVAALAHAQFMAGQRGKNIENRIE